MYITEILNKIIDTPYSAFFYTPDICKNKSYLFSSEPAEILETNNPDEFKDALLEIDNLNSKGYYGYGIIPYESGYLLEKKLDGLWMKSDQPIVRFSFFRRQDVYIYKPGEIKFFISGPKNFRISGFNLNTSKKEYSRAIFKIKDHIERGNTYQVNYTLKGTFRFAGDVSAFFTSLVFNQSAPYTAFINNNNNFIISISPELFFEKNKNVIVTKPMKGTLRRGYNLQEDNNKKQFLKHSEKNNAENIMIVDLLRNDLGKISKYGKVGVNDFFKIEKYESLLQMTSNIKAELKEGIGIGSILKNIFPCGSVTGAPKISTMQIINKLENESRGIYTGTIGLLLNNKSVFNVAIRTIELNKKLNTGKIGLGSGIVWDSNPEEEYEEILLKSGFLTNPEKFFKIYETIIIEHGKLFLGNEHLKRLKNAASFFLFNFKKQKIESEVNNLLSTLNKKKKYRLKVLLDKWGNIETELTEFNEATFDIDVVVSDKRISSANKFQYFKTTRRDLYTSELEKYSSKGYWDVIFFNERNELAEGARTNIFIRKYKTWFTPPVSSGILNGVYRGFLLTDKKKYKEKILYKEDLLNADEIMLTNALRKEIKVKKIKF